ncbi:hypothetical protein NMY22_g2230 [Coprinellus aureogranulatus]|nr:hypothetical protein NMY22_g2230 [Coprinellus aureogranulatus]
MVGRASGLISQPKQDRARIHSIRATLHRGSNVESLATLIKGLKASALSELFIKTTSAADLGPIELQRHYSSLLPMTLTTLELHIGSQVVDGDLVKQALERCPGLTSLVLGGLFLDTSGLQTTNSPNDSPIHAPALRRLALGTPIFRTFHNRAECNNDCPCPFRKLVVDKLEYLEVAGDSVRETLPHLLPFIQRRLSKVGQSSTAQPPLALIINSGTSFSLFNNGHDKDLMRSLPRDVHLHLLNDDSDYPRKPNICEWFQSTRSTVLYLQRSQTQKSLAGFRRLQPRGGLVPVIIHPSGNASQHIQDGNAEARGWVLSGSDANGPFMNPNQPSIDDDVYGYEYGYLDDDEDMYSGGYSSDERFDWQEYRRSLGWPDGYDTPSP